MDQNGASTFAMSWSADVYYMLWFLQICHLFLSSYVEIHFLTNSQIQLIGLNMAMWLKNRIMMFS